MVETMPHYKSVESLVGPPDKKPAKPPRDPRLATSRHILTTRTTRHGGSQAAMIHGRALYPIVMADGKEFDATELKAAPLFREMQRRGIRGVKEEMGREALLTEYGKYLDAQDAAARAKAKGR